MNENASHSGPSKARRLPVPAQPTPTALNTNAPEQKLPTHTTSDSSPAETKEQHAPPRDLPSSARGGGRRKKTRRKNASRQRRNARRSWDDLVKPASFEYPTRTNDGLPETPSLPLPPPPPEKPRTKATAWAALSIVLAAAAVVSVMDRWVEKDKPATAQPDRPAPSSVAAESDESEVQFPADSAAADADSSNFAGQPPSPHVEPHVPAPAAPATVRQRASGSPPAAITVKQQVTAAQAQIDAISADLSRTRQDLANLQQSLNPLRQQASQNAAASAAAEEERQRLAYFDLPRLEQERADAYQLYASLRAELDAAGSRSDLAARTTAAIRAEVDRSLATAADKRRRARDERDQLRHRLGAKRDDFSEAVAEAAAKARERRWVEETARPYEAQKLLAAVERYDRLVLLCNAAAQTIAGLDDQLAEARRTIAYLEARTQALAAMNAQLNRQIAELQRQADGHTLLVAELEHKAADAARALAELRTQVAAL